jgi:hypothetical protein
LAPCISATLSADGNALVVNELTYGDQLGTYSLKVKTSTFRVFRRYRDPNADRRVNGPNRYWGDASWEVAFTIGSPPFVSCPYTLVTDDAEYLVLLGDGEPVALSIYRRDERLRPTGSVGPPGGVLVRKVASSDLSPEVPVPPVWTDETPEWFSSGTFSFSADQRTLIFTTSVGKRLQISLSTGNVQR